MAPMRRAVEGKSPMEIVEMQARGELEGAVSMADFAKAMQTTQPSSSDKEHEEYAAWNNLYGCKS
jgi:SpoVK/Ycf46/Vps4 family AAA+-type ATPase